MRKSSSSSQFSRSHRHLRVGEVIRRALVDVLVREEVIDPTLNRLTITVPEVRMCTDLKTAICYVMPLGGQDKDKVIEALTRHTPFLRGRIARRVSLRYIPQLRFQLDHSFDDGAAIDQLLQSEVVVNDTGGTAR